MKTRYLDLDTDSGEALEFHALLEVVASHAATGLGAGEVRSLRPACSPERVATQLATVGETGRYLETGGRLVPGNLPDPRQAVERLEMKGVHFETEALRDLAAVLEAAGDLQETLAGLEGDDYPELHRMGKQVPDLRAEAREVLGNVEADGSISDGASSELRRIRRSSARVGQRLRTMLESYLRSRDAGAIIQDEFITQRNGRYVIPVRTDAPRKMRGIVHASSSSGATMFVEPLPSVDLNNELVHLAEREIEEQNRILERWAEMFRAVAEEVREAVASIARADALQARAQFGRAVKGCLPEVRAGAPLVLDRIRHPLLDRRMRQAGGGCRPVDLHLDPYDSTLLISGPNAGGKTVALKTLGLAVLMAQTGIPVPAEGASLPLYEQVRADIGDHQSIESDLSTFSAHVKAIAAFTREARLPALFLFDEIGTGTEPTEGAALAQAVLEALLVPGMSVAATTHHGALKAWAITEPRAVSAAMEFDRETLQPTYRVLMGAAGVSAGLEIAGRIGVESETLERARELLGSDARRTEAYLDRIRDLVEEMEAARGDLARRSDDLDRRERRRREEIDREVARFRSEAEKTLEKALEEFRERGRREIDRVHGKRQKEVARREQAAAERRMKMAVRPIATAVAQERQADTGDGPGKHQSLEAGRKVLIRSLDREGEIVRLRGRKAEVRLGTVSFTVERTDLIPLDGESGQAPEAPPHVSILQAEPGVDDLGDAAPTELLLLGKTVDEALPMIDKFLDEAAMAGYGEVRVVHGHGTGRLRSAVREFLRGHPHAASQRPGKPAEGGDGATVVRLA